MFFLLQIVQFIINIFLFKKPYNPVFNVIGNCHERDEVEDSSAEESGFLIIQLNKRTKTTSWKTGAQSKMTLYQRHTKDNGSAQDCRHQEDK